MNGMDASELAHRGFAPTSRLARWLGARGQKCQDKRTKRENDCAIVTIRRISGAGATNCF